MTFDRFPTAASALRELHVREEFGDCQEDGDPFPCKTIQILEVVETRMCDNCGDSVPWGYTIEDDHHNCNFPEDFEGVAAPDPMDGSRDE